MVTWRIVKAVVGERLQVVTVVHAVCFVEAEEALIRSFASTPLFPLSI